MPFITFETGGIQTAYLELVSIVRELVTRFLQLESKEYKITVQLISSYLLPDSSKASQYNSRSVNLND